jgi:hypothetical protein
VKNKALLAVLVVVLAACTATPVVWDDSVPEEKLTTIYFIGITPYSYNGIPVSNWLAVKIPAGTAKIDCNVNYAGYNAKDKTFSYNFEAGKSYNVAFNIVEGYWGVGIYDAADKKKARLTFIDFK